ncbi:hypothetical protein C8R44DRAFT_990090 [Mycena epipterygia]|nr:hypothetical protein C8R44DRAFT_990090 [Mycena epipterygia]
MNFSIDPAFSPLNFPSESRPSEWQTFTPPLFPDYLEYFSSSSLSDRSSSTSPPQSNVSSPDALHVTCDLPLVAPTPIPFQVPDLASFDFTNIDCVMMVNAISAFRGGVLLSWHLGHRTRSRMPPIAGPTLALQPVERRREALTPPANLRNAMV